MIRYKAKILTLSLVWLLLTSCFTIGDKTILNEKNQETSLEPIPKIAPFPVRLSEQTRSLFQLDSRHLDLLQELSRLFPDNKEFPPATITFDIPRATTVSQASVIGSTGRIKYDGDACAKFCVVDTKDLTRALFSSEGKAPVVLVTDSRSPSTVMNFAHVCMQNACVDLLRKLDAPDQRDALMKVCKDYQAVAAATETHTKKSLERKP